MDELSADEFLVLLFSFPAAILFLLVWLITLWKSCPFDRHTPARGSLTVIPIAAVALLVYVLERWADKEVRGHQIYVVLFIALGLAWMGASVLIARVLGVRLRDDLADRGNPAAAPVLGGAVLGVALCNSGSNIGGGETIWSTILPAVLATVVWSALWMMMEVTTGISEAISIERDLATGRRLGGALVANGLILGRAMAGNYHGAGETLRDLFHHGRFAFVVSVATIVLQWLWRPRPERRSDPVLRGSAPAALLIAAAIAYVLHAGPWDGYR